MSYCALADLNEAFGTVEVLRLLDRDSNGVADPTYTAQLIADADAEIDSYLRVRYALPLALNPPRLKTIACDIVRYRAYTFEPIDVVIARYKDAISYLRDVAAGRVQLGVATLPEAAEDSGSPDWVVIDRVFDADTLADF
jgi:phage gp36-like protein